MTRREAGLAAMVALVAALVFTWPLALHPSGRLVAPAGPGDPYLNYWILGWDLDTITRQPSALLTGRIFDANIFYPADRTLAYSDHLILQAVLLAPLYLATGSVAVCYNALWLLSMAASALAMFAFVRGITGSRSGAALAGLAWGFMPFRVAHLLHLQLQSLYWLPLAFLCLHRLMAGRRRRDAVALGVVAGLQAVSSVYWGVIGAVALVIGAAALAVGVGRWRSALVMRRLLLAGAVGAVIVAPFAWPYWQVQQREGFARNLFEAAQHEATPSSYLRVPPENLLYGRTGWLRPPAPDGPGGHEGPEQAAFPGLVLAALAGLGAWAGWRSDRKPTVLAMAAVIVTGFVLSLGPDGVRPLYAFLHRVVFGFQAVRAPARFGVLVTFGLAVLAAAGLEWIEGRRRFAHGGVKVVSRALPIVLVAAAGVEYWSVPLPTVAAPARSTAAGRWLRAEPSPGAVLYLPLDADLGNTRAMVASLEHRRPIVNGYSGQRPAFFRGLVDVMAQLPSADAVWALRDLNVRFVVSPSALPVPDGGPLVERVRFADAVIYGLDWTPASEARVPRPELPAPPEPGPLPFAAGESLVYRVLWRNGASMGVPAGTATFTAAPAGEPGGAVHRLAVEIETAPWVARFFEARDRIETTADASLVPVRQDQHLREGRRVVDRTSRFDPAARTVTTGDGPPLPWPRGAREGLTAFFYARTLPLAPGYTVRFPVVEGGRRYTVELVVAGRESIEVAGRRVDAWRAEPRLSSSGSGGRTIRTTIWISADARRVPVLLEIDTAFGAFRAELERESHR